MLIICRLSVLPHKHPHELLDSVVKEQLVKLSPQPRPRILQQPFFLSSCFSKNFFFLLNNLQQPQLHLFRFGEARILQHLATPSSCF